jgi:hypothetical protein
MIGCTLTPSLAAKLASLVVHAIEQRQDGHHDDEHAIAALLADAEVRAWARSIQVAAMAPLMRRGDGLV